jgi:tetratricopeptide (TPR) repeat protein
VKKAVRSIDQRFIISSILLASFGLCGIGTGFYAPAPVWAADIAPVTPVGASDTKAAIPEESGTIVDNQPLTDLDRFALLEKRFFGHGYPNDTIEDRLFRMENLVFGSKSKAPLPDRIKKLEATLGSVTPVANTGALNPGETAQVAAPASTAGAAPVNTATVKDKDAPKTFNSLYEQAMADIDASRFHAASEELEQAIQLNPNNAKAYSLLATTLLRLQDRDGAKEAFRACFQVDPFGPDGRNAKAMLLKMVNDDTVRATAPQDTPQVVDHTMRALSMQAADLSNRYRQDGERWATYRRYLGGIEAAKIQNETNDYINGFRGGGGGFGSYRSRYGGGGGYGGMTAYDRQEISDLGRLRSNYVRTDAAVQGNKARAEAALKASYVQESAANLKDQLLKGKFLPDDAVLKALGTSLYCRYFGDETPSVDEPPVPDDPVLELRAKALTLNPGRH